MQLRCRQDGREWTRTIGVNGANGQADAERHARTSINTPRRVHDGMACEFTDVQSCQMWEWRARQIAAQAPEHFAREVAGWQRNSERQAV